MVSDKNGGLIAEAIFHRPKTGHLVLNLGPKLSLLRDRAKTGFVATSGFCPLRGAGGRRGPLSILFTSFLHTFIVTDGR